MEDEDAVPQIIKIGDFHNEVIPEPNSIIWAPIRLSDMIL